MFIKYESQHPKSMSYGEELKKKIEYTADTKKIVVAILVSAMELAQYFMMGTFLISVGIATDYGLDGLGSNPGWDEIFRPSRPALGPTQPPAKWVPGLSWG